jgi:hypothetical protein
MRRPKKPYEISLRPNGKKDISIVNVWQSFNYSISVKLYFFRRFIGIDIEMSKIYRTRAQRLFSELKRSAQKKREITPPLPYVHQEFRPSERPK